MKHAKRGQCREIYDPKFFSQINSPWVTDYHPKIFSNLVSMLPKYSGILVDSVLCDIARVNSLNVRPS
jgi:hypothetical protein